MLLLVSLKRSFAVSLLVAGILFSSAIVFAQDAPQGVPENMFTRVSDHVYAIVGFPNIAIVVGNRATLVVDTGLGPHNGSIIVREVQKLTENFLNEIKNG